jgi:autotransporter-associated beta strand protein
MLIRNGHEAVDANDRPPPKQIAAGKASPTWQENPATAAQTVAADRLQASGSVVSNEPAASMALPVDFLPGILSADQKSIAFELPDGGMLEGTVAKLSGDAQGPLLVEGVITRPQPGRFHFRRQTLPGKAGRMFGFVYFDEADTAWQVRPVGEHGAPLLVRTTVHEVVCRSYAAPAERIPANHPTDDPIPAAENDIIQLQSLPGAEAVVYLDFDGEERDFEFWRYVNAAPSGASNSQIFQIWQGVCEDFQPFNINITTIRAVFDAAAPNQRMQVIITPTDDAYPGVGGAAITGSFNTEGDVVCWSFQTTGKNAIEVISHEVGHTLGLSHDGRIFPNYQEYYAGHNGWAPIMGVGYDQPLTQWSKGEYPGANNLQDDLSIISTNNNGVDYRADDFGQSHSTAAWLDVTEDGYVYGEGIIEVRGDRDSFRFSTNGGNLSIQIDPIPPIQPSPGNNQPVGNLDIKAELIRVTSSLTSIIATSDPANSLSATFNIPILAAGDYFIRITGTGRGNTTTGYSDYASLGSYTLNGTLDGGVHADRFVIAENSPANTVVGTVLPRANHSTGLLNYQISNDGSGGAFAIDPGTGAISVADASLLDFENLSSRWDDPATLDFLVTITDNLDFATEIIRVVVIVSDANEPPVFEPLSELQIPANLSVGTVVGSVHALDPDRADFATYAIVAGNAGGTFAIDPNSGEISLAAPLNYPATTSYQLTIRATDQRTAPNSVDAPLTVNLLALPPGITTGSILRTFYQDIPGSAVADLTSSPRFPDKPHRQSALTLFDAGANGSINYGSTICAYLIPPVSGDYTFWISASDSGELWLSSDADPANASLVAAITSASMPDQWSKETGQQSTPVTLQAGMVYYIEARHKQESGPDHLRVAWQGPGMAEKRIIPGLWLAPYDVQYAPWAENASFTVREGAAESTVVGGISFTEPNLGQQVQAFAITAGNEDGFFTIGETDGLIRVAAGAELIGGQIYQLTISATDDGEPAATGSATATISVRRLDEGLYAWWQLDESSGTGARDSSGNQRNAWLTGNTAWITRAEANNALQLNGTGSGFYHYDFNAPSGATPFTVAAWVRIPASHDSEAVIIQQTGDSFPPQPGYYRVSVTDEGRVRFVVHGNTAEAGDEGDQFDLISATSIHDGEWQHVACVRDGDNGRIFINGVESASASGTVRMLDQNSNTSVGYDLTTMGLSLVGEIDDVRIYQDALSGSQLARVAGAPKLAITMPGTSPAVIPPGMGLFLETASSDPDGPAPSITWSQLEGPGGVTFDPLDATTTAVRFPLNGIYKFRATASDGVDSVSREITVQAGCTASSPFAGSPYGIDSYGGHLSTGTASYQLFGASAGLQDGGTEDGFYLLGQNFTGNFDLRVRVDGTSDDDLGEPWGLAGLIVRGGIGAELDLASGFIGLNGASGQGAWIHRGLRGGHNVAEYFNSMTAPHWCRITRSGDAVEFWHSTDGSSWVSRGTMNLAGEVRAGLCWSSNYLALSGSASFSGLAGFSTGNVGPAANAGSDFAAETGIATTLAGSLVDDGLPNPPAAVALEWSVISGPAGVVIEDPADPASSVTFQSAGTYLLRLIADDGALRTFDEVSINVTNPTPVVSVIATTAEASETGPASGVFTITRSLWLAGDLTVDFNLGGTAGNGSDFTQALLSVVIPDGQAAVEVVVAPVADSLVEGPETVTLTLASGNYIISGDPATVTIRDSNHAPAWSQPSFAVEDATEGTPYVGASLSGLASDPDQGDGLTFEKTNGPDWLLVDENGTLGGTPDADDVGSNIFTVRATDSGGLYVEAELQIFVIYANVQPEFAADPLTLPAAMAHFAYQNQSLAAYVNDPNLTQGDTISFSKTSGPEWLDVAPDGTLSGTPGGADIGPNSFTIRVADLGGAFDEVTLEIIVDPAVLYLDANGTTPGSGGPATVQWDDAGLWSADSTGTAETIPWIPGAVAVFAAGDDLGECTATLTGTRAVAGIRVGEGPLTLTSGTLDLTAADAVFDIAASTIIESPITGINLAKTGNGTLTLTNSIHSLSGSLVVENGTLSLAQGLSVAGGVSISGPGSLTGSGPLEAAVSVAGTMAPAEGIGTFSAGALALVDGARLEWQTESWMASPGNSQDLVAAETLDLAGNITVRVDAAAIANFTDEYAEFTLVSTTSGITGFATANFTVDVTGLPEATGHWNVIQSGVELRLSYTPLTPFERWQIDQFESRASDPLVAGELADPDGDGIPNLTEYALGTEPELPSTSGIIQEMVPIDEAYYLRLTIPRNPDATDVTFTVQTTSDLTEPDSWTDIDTVVETDEPALLVVRDTLGGPLRFIRLRVSR